MKNNLIRFNIGEFGAFCLGQGWGNPERWGVRSVSQRADVVLPVLKLERRAVCISIHYECAAPVTIYINNRILVSVKFVQTQNCKILKIYVNLDFVESKNILAFEFCGYLELYSMWFEGATFVGVPLLSDAVVKCFDIPDVSNPLFIAGIPRSGTTIVAKVLQTLFNGKFDLSESFFFDFLHTHNRIGSFQYDSCVAYLHDPEMQIFNHIFFELLRACEAMPIEAKYRDLVRIYFSLSMQKSRSVRLVEKTPSNILYWNLIFKIFPSAKMVFCVRRPVEIFASMKKRASASTVPDSGGRKSEYWLNISCEEFINSFFLYIESALEALKHYPRNIFILDYNRISARDSCVMYSLSQFLGVYPEALAKHFFDSAHIAEAGVVPSGLLASTFIDNRIPYERYLESDDVDKLCGVERDPRYLALFDSQKIGLVEANDTCDLSGVF